MNMNEQLNIIDSIDKNEVINLPQNFKPPTILSGEETKKENKKEWEDSKDILHRHRHI